MQVNPKKILQQYWGYTNFRLQQETVIKSVLEGNDTLALLPTGGGKSICYQLPALLVEGITIVICPLISLMIDQVNRLKKLGIKALALPSGTQKSELDTLLDNCIYGNYKLLYLSPERLKQPLVIERIKQMKVSLIAVDEAHCISQWGHDFRPAYLDIIHLREITNNANIIAVTATATPQVVNDIKTHLKLKTPTFIKDSFLRKNLNYYIHKTTDKHETLLNAIKKAQNSCIVYVRSRKATIQLSNFLNTRGVKAAFYHGGLHKKDRQNVYEQWYNNKSKVVIATSAFGMGIDKENVSLVVHFELPETIENYFQEAGRAGRDGNKAQTLLLYNDNDIQKLNNQFLKSLPKIEDVKLIYNKLCNYFQITYGEGQDKTYNLNFSEFCTTYNIPSLLTYNCLILLDRNEIITFNKNFIKNAAISFNVTAIALTYYLIKNKRLDTVVKSVLRTYGGIKNQLTPINFNVIANKANVTVQQLHNLFLVLEKDNIITYQHKSFDTAVTLLLPREDDRTINRIRKNIKGNFDKRKQQLNAVISFIKQKEICRNKWLLNYFDEKISQNCGLCDVCRSQTDRAPKQLHLEILKILSKQPLSSKAMTHLGTTDDIFAALSFLLDSKKIKILPNNKYTLL